MRSLLRAVLAAPAGTGRTNVTGRRARHAQVPSGSGVACRHDAWVPPIRPLRRPGRRRRAVALGAGLLRPDRGVLIRRGQFGRPRVGGSSATNPLSPHAAITLAADQTERVTSMAATFSEQITGTVAEATSGTVKVQMKPLLLAERGRRPCRPTGQTFPIDEIVSGQGPVPELQHSLSVFNGQTGKAWFEIPFASLSGNFGTSLTGLLQDVPNGEPA